MCLAIHLKSKFRNTSLEIFTLITTLSFGYFSNTLTGFTYSIFLNIYLNLSDYLDFSNKSPCLYAKFMSPFLLHLIYFTFSHSFTKIVVSSQFLTLFDLKFNLTTNPWFEKLLFHPIDTFPSMFFLLLYFWSYVAIDEK